MNISYFKKHTALNAEPVLSAFIKGAQSQGHTCSADDLNADAVVIWSVLWSGRMKANQNIYQHYITQNKPVFVLDIGCIHRGQTWKLAVNNLNAFGYYGHTENLDPDRPKKLQMSVCQSHTNNGKIVLCLQHQHSHQVAHLASLDQWAVDQIRQVRQHTDRPIDIRPHPRATFNPGLFHFPHNVVQPQKLSGTYDSFDFDAKQYYAVINCNSSPGILAAMQGVRPLVDHSSLAWPVHCGLDAIEQPYDKDRQQWIIEISHTEYTLDELAAGLWAQRLNHIINP